jgi:hypothetical protein
LRLHPLDAWLKDFWSITRQALKNLLNLKAGFSPEMAITLINQAFRLRGINPGADQNGCYPPVETPLNSARSALRGIFDLISAVAG